MHTATKPAAIPKRQPLDQWRTEADHSDTTTGCVLVVAEHALLGAGLRAALAERGWDAETTDDVAECNVVERDPRARGAVCAARRPSGWRR